MGFIIF